MDQKHYWNAEAGATWAAMADALDAMLAPLGDAAVSALDPQGGEAVLDIGCGAGATSRAIAARGASVTGVDLSAPLLSVAQARGGARFIEADAGAHAYDQRFDAAFSRFGVMFFDAPEAAFAHIRAATVGGRLAFVCWRALSENPWALEPLAAALPHLPEPPAPPPPGAPGPFAFADPDRVRAVLDAAGWRDIGVEAWDGAIRLGADLDSTLDLTLKIGPLGRLLREHPKAAEPALVGLRQSLQARTGVDGAVRMPAAAWIVTAKA